MSSSSRSATILRGLFLATASLAAVSPSAAQKVEVTPYVGYTTAGSLDRTAPQIDSLEIRGGFTWGAQLDYFLSPNLGLELSWTQQETALGLTASGRNARLFDVDAGQLHAGVLYQFGGKREGLRPFVLGTFGATFLRASDVASATKFSWAVGGGLKAYLGNHLGLRFQARYDPTRLGDGSSGEFCDPFGFCADTLHQFELGVGVLFRF